MGGGAEELLGLLEPGWRNHLLAGGLAGAVDVEPELPHTIARALGGLTRQGSPGALAERWPGCVAVALAGVAGDGYRRGRFWPAWHRACGARASGAADAAWGGAFLTALRVLGREAADPRTAVLVQAAIPAACLPELLRLLRLGGSERELARIDPAVELLLDSGEPAARALLSGLRSALAGDDGGPDEQLPRRLAAAVRLAAPDPDGVRPLRLDPYGRGVLLAVDPDGRDWRSATPDQVGAAVPDLLVFDQDGAMLRAALPPQPVWALCRDDAGLRADVTLRTVVESRLPLPWRGWRLIQVDLGQAAWLAVGSGPGTDRRPVRGRSRPSLVPGPAVPGLSSEHGLTVHHRLPVIRLPGGESRWMVEVRRSPGGPLLGRAEGSARDWDDRRLWDRVSRPLLGELLVTAVALDEGGERTEAPAGLRGIVFVAEGLDVQYDPPLRLTGATGPEPGTALLVPAAGMTSAPGAVQLATGMLCAPVRLVAGPVVRTLLTTPPHLRVRIEPEPGSGNTATPWHNAGPLPIGPAELRRGGALRLDLPGLDRDPPLAVVAADSRTVQWLEPSRQGRYPLRRLLDTAAALGRAELRITVAGHEATVATVTAPLPAADPWITVQS
ncbi:hypothetical protein EDD99_3863 [Streptomyces sp. 846.5]|nr:hypothetical protein [Streptomyces sp. 846.5]TDU05353.1 hypothetical protein EDD99_3863 [Streptomyces sp. 846.5]